jgi:hypothetical protein
MNVTRRVVQGSILGTAAALGILLSASPAHAWWRGGVGVGVGVGIFVPPVVVAPAPVYVPPPTYYAPAPTVYAPSPVAYAGPPRVWIPAHWEVPLLGAGSLELIPSP